MESLGVFVSLDLTIQIAGLSIPLTEVSTATYFGARGVLAALYLGNILYVRTVAWLTGQFCLLALGYGVIVQAF